MGEAILALFAVAAAFGAWAWSLGQWPNGS
jgi:hypothetical protein